MYNKFDILTATAHALRFFQAESKNIYIVTTNLTYLQLLPYIIIFINKKVKTRM